MLGAHFRVVGQQVLTNHDQWHEQYLDHIGYEQPEHEGHWRIELPRRGGQQIPAQPADCLSENTQEERHRADANSDPECQPIRWGYRLEHLRVKIA
jgi:hypothetical protein